MNSHFYRFDSDPKNGNLPKVCTTGYVGAASLGLASAGKMTAGAGGLWLSELCGRLRI